MPDQSSDIIPIYYNNYIEGVVGGVILLLMITVVLHVVAMYASYEN